MVVIHIVFFMPVILLAFSCNHILFIAKNEATAEQNRVFFAEIIAELINVGHRVGNDYNKLRDYLLLIIKSERIMFHCIRSLKIIRVSVFRAPYYAY